MKELEGQAPSGVLRKVAGIRTGRVVWLLLIWSSEMVAKIKKRAMQIIVAVRCRGSR